MRHDEFVVEVYNAVQYLLLDVVTPERIRDTVRHLDVGDDLLLPSTAEVRTQLVWEELRNWLVEEEKLVEDYPLELVEGLCGAQAHTWITCSTKVHRMELDPIPPVFIIDVSPQGVLPSPLLIGPGSPLRLLYRKRKVPADAGERESK